MKFRYLCYFDGACEPTNPGGHMGMGYFVKDQQTDAIIKEGKLYVSANTINTNNVAEYMALRELLNYLRAQGIKKAHIRGDSKLVINQMSKVWKIKKGAYANIARACLTLVNLQFDQLKFEWVRRNFNEYADGLSKAALSNNGVTETMETMLTDDSPLNWGKAHKGTPLGEVPDQYLYWMYDAVGTKKLPPNIATYLAANIDSIKSNLGK